MAGCETKKPVLQVMGTKRITTNGNVRYRLLVSDGKNFISYAMLATQLNGYAEHELADNTIIRILKYMVSKISRDNKVIVILEMEVLHPGADVNSVIGNPIPLMSHNVPKESAQPDPTVNKTSTRQANGNGNSSNSLGNSSNNSSAVMSIHVTSPIATLTPYQNKWVIKVRVTSKSNIRTWKNSRSEGKLFSMNLMDESGEIRATCFNNACDKYFDMIQVWSPRLV